MDRSSIPQGGQTTALISYRRPHINVRVKVACLLCLALVACFHLWAGRKAIQNPTTTTSARLMGEEVEPYSWRMAMDKIAEIQKSLNSLWCRTQSVLPNGGFCLTNASLVVGGNEYFDPMLCSAVEALSGRGSVADFGAGLGLYGMCLLRKQEMPYVASPKMKAQIFEQYRKQMGSKYDTPQVVASWDGVDGADNVDVLSGGFIRYADLSDEDLWLGRRWDWVMSVEVGEHIPPNKETFFLDNIVRHACQGVLLTWAVEGQDGLSHVNTRNNDYIKARMEERGLANDLEEENKIRKSLNYQHLSNTVMVFRFPDPKECALS